MKSGKSFGKGRECVTCVTNATWKKVASPEPGNPQKAENKQKRMQCEKNNTRYFFLHEIKKERKNIEKKSIKFFKNKQDQVRKRSKGMKISRRERRGH